MFAAIREPLNSARDQAKEFLQKQGHKPKVFRWGNFLAFFNNIPVVVALIRVEPEILIFAGLQWFAVWLAYLGWTQVLYWIPDQVWQAAGNDNNGQGAFDLISIVLLVWSFFIVCVASYPIGLCNAAMVAVHDLRTCGEKFSLAKCLAIADRHQGRIWMFTILDGWITVNMILNRMPRKGSTHSALDELIYYAWKLATMGVVPALVNGRGYLDAGKDSVTLLTSEPVRALGLRFGYSAVCWVVGILSYIGAIFFYAKFAGGGEFKVYTVYLIAAGPICVAVGIISVIVRPVFLLGVAKFYTDLIDVRREVEEDIASMPSWEKSVFSWQAGLFLAMLSALVIMIFFGNQLGLTAWIHSLAQKDLARYYQH